MNLGQSIAEELKREAVATRKMLERVPADSFAWQPHEKSMILGQLASHVADVTGWIPPIVTQEELDFAKSDFKPARLTTPNELVEHFDESLDAALGFLHTASDEHLRQSWRLRKGEHLILEMPRADVIRTMVLSHLIHHRGQLSVYLRLKNVPLPPVYGPSADEG